MIGWKLVKWKDLTKKSRINICALGCMCEDLKDLHIYNLCISLPKYGIKTVYRESAAHEYGEVQIYFDYKYSDGDTHTLEMHAHIYLGRHTVEAIIVGEADYSNMNEGYDATLQDYLFTYFVNIISSDKRLARFGNFHLPNKLSSYYPECEWRPTLKISYHRDGYGEPFSVERLSGKSTIPLILQAGIVTNKKEEEENE